MLSVLLALCLPIAALLAQTHLSVEIKDPVYELLELGELKGLIGTLSGVRPFARSQVIELLDRMWDERGTLSPAEQAVLSAARERFEENRSGLKHGNLVYRPDDEAPRQLQAGADLRSQFRLNANQPEDWHLDSVMQTYLRGDLGPWLSYLGIVGLTVDRVRSEEAFAPYSFSKEWDTFHFRITSPRFSHGDLDSPTMSYILGMEIAARFLEQDMGLSLARQRREWSVGEGSLTLGGSARPFLGVESHLQLTPWLALHNLFGSLDNWEEEPGGIDAILGTLSYQKLFALQRLELVPLPWLSLAASGSLVGARRFEMMYMAPLLFGAFAQNLIGDLDNFGLGAEVAITIAPYGRAYLSMFADELGLERLGDLFTRPRNIFALQGGLKLPIPLIPLSILTLQYTKIEPFAYAHYPTDYPDYRIPVDTAYTHDGENLAYHLWPNSDELLVKISSLPLPQLQADLEYRLIRHGDNPSSSPGDPAILGRPDGYYDYSKPDDSYPDKAFLHDGLYDHNHIVTVRGVYSFRDSPFRVGLSYTFSYTYWEPNASGEPDRPDVVRNILGLEFSVFR